MAKKSCLWCGSPMITNKGETLYLEIQGVSVKVEKSSFFRAFERLKMYHLGNSILRLELGGEYQHFITRSTRWC